MKKILIINLFVLMSCATLVAQAWEHIYTNGSYMRFATSLCMDYDDGMLINLAEQNSNGNGNRIVLLKTDEDGKILFNKTIGNINPGAIATHINLINSNYFISGVGSKYDTTGAACLIKLNECKNPLFIKEFGIKNDYDYSTQVESSLDSNIFLEVQYFGIDIALNPERQTMLKLTENGDSLWQINFTPNYAFGTDFSKMIITLDSGILAIKAGYIADPGQTSPVIIRSIATKISKNGIIEWSMPYGVNDYYYSHGKHAVQLQDSSFVILSSFEDLTSNLKQYNYLIKIDAQGNVQWHKFISDTNNISEVPCGIFAINDSEIVVISSVSDNPNFQTFTDRRVKIHKLDLNGNVKDTNTVGNNYQIALSCIMDKNKDIVVCGQNTQLPNQPRAFALKIRSSDLQLDTMKNQSLVYDYLCPNAITSGYIPYDTSSSIGFAEKSNFINFSVFPNPVASVLYINANGKALDNRLTAHIYNAMGQEIDKIIISKNQQILSINVSNYASGIYTVCFVINNATVGVRRFVRE